MTAFTTPTYTLTFPEGTSFSGTTDLYVTLVQGSRRITKTREDGAVTVSGNILSVGLTQAESGIFRPNVPVEIMVNWTYADGKRGASDITTVTVGKNLIPEVLA